MSLMEDSLLSGSIVSDEMGLGKTIQCLALIMLKAERMAEHGLPDRVGEYRPTLILGPAATLAL